MFNKMIAAFALLAVLGAGAYAMSSSRAVAKKGVVEVTVLDWSPAGEAADCEYTVTPHSVVIAGDHC